MTDQLPAARGIMSGIAISLMAWIIFGAAVWGLWVLGRF